LSVVIDANHVVTDVGETRSRDETNVSGTDD